MKCFDMKVVGYQTIAAESEEEALEKFDQMMRDGFKVIDLRWKSVEAESLNEEDWK